MSRRKPAFNQRGISIPETLSVIVIAGLLMTVAASLSQPVLHASSAQRAEADLVDATNRTLYFMQRDIRQSDPNGIFVCFGSGPTLTCDSGSSFAVPTDIACLAVLTGRTDGNDDMNWDSSGRPAWTGFQVYWLVPDGNGANNLAYAFAPAQIQPGVDPAIHEADVIDSVLTAKSSASPQIVAGSLQKIQTMVDVSKDRVSLRLVAQSVQSSTTNTTSVESDVYARN